MTITGTVKRFFSERGYGFITPRDGDNDIFVHQRDIGESGLLTLNAGDHVEFETAPGSKGPRAINIQLVN